MASYYGSTGGDGEKKYSTKEFRRAFPASTAVSGDVMRHKFDLELAAAGAAYMSGPKYGADAMRHMSAAMRESDNVHYYGSKAANTRDHAAATKVLRSAYTGEKVILGAHEAAHIREGAAWLAAHKKDFTPAYVKSVSSLYQNVVDKDGHKVVDRRTLRS